MNDKLVKRNPVRIPDEILPPEDPSLDLYRSCHMTDAWDFDHIDATCCKGEWIVPYIRIHARGLTLSDFEQFGTQLPEGYELCRNEATRCFHIRKKLLSR